ncbi:SDR family NAD(P)-dependent oxidoreductase [Brevibacillus sp. NRS-1366]|uniref:SDR family NAD(P)-dependent oxidoreductase n=1 Tax=Brevibacillus sp. NRS-1366 TaxID=3233899 RepID=UPI003D25BF1B
MTGTREVVTGAGSGMGRATSLRLAEMGMKMVLVDFSAKAFDNFLHVKGLCYLFVARIA